MKRPTCCTFHSLGGPTELTCDNYDHASPVECPDSEAQPLFTFADLDDWDAYSQAQLEHGSMVADSLEDYGSL